MIKGKTIPITNPNATRFWIGMKEANNFVMDCIELMDEVDGGEIFVPKIPSVQIMNVYQAMTDGLTDFHVIGDRIGDKLHETLVTKEEVKHTVDLGNKYVIYPEDPHYAYTKPEELMCSYTKGYTSDGNKMFLSVEEIKQTLKENK